MINLNDNLHDVTQPIIGKNPCRDCGDKLIVGDNWYDSYYKKNSYICIDCNRIKNKMWRKNNPEKEKQKSKRSHRTRRLKKNPITHFRDISRLSLKRSKFSHLNPENFYKELVCLFCASYGICPFTNTKMNLKNCHLDHILSVSKGGKNEYNNLVFVKHIINYSKNGFGLNKFFYEMRTLIDKDLVMSRISKIHNRYEFMIDDYLKMTDEQLELCVNDILNTN